VSRRVGARHCDVDPRHWSRYLDGEFSVARCQECEVHLAGCRECQAELGDVRRILAACRAARRSLPARVRRTMRRRAREIARPRK
jgi:anti-sigma factor RsiW